MNPQEALERAKMLGLTLPTPGYLLGAVVFGLVGWMAFRAGRRQHRPRMVWMGVALMLFPYLISETWALYAVGALLCAGLWMDLRS